MQVTIVHYKMWVKSICTLVLPAHTVTKPISKIQVNAHLALQASIVLVEDLHLLEIVLQDTCAPWELTKLHQLELSPILHSPLGNAHLVIIVRKEVLTQ